MRLAEWPTAQVTPELWLAELHQRLALRVTLAGGRCRLRIDGEFGKLTFANKERASAVPLMSSSASSTAKLDILPPPGMGFSYSDFQN